MRVAPNPTPSFACGVIGSTPRECETSGQLVVQEAGSFNVTLSTIGAMLDNAHQALNKAIVASIESGGLGTIQNQASLLPCRFHAQFLPADKPE